LGRRFQELGHALSGAYEPQTNGGESNLGHLRSHIGRLARWLVLGTRGSAT